MAEDLIKWRSMRIEGIEAKLQMTDVSGAKVELLDAFARLTVETNRAINLLAALQPLRTNAAPKPTALETEKATTKISRKALAQVKDVLSQTNAFGITNLLKVNVGMFAIS